MASPVVDLANIGANMAMQKVIGISGSKTKVTKKGSKNESWSIGIQAWELGIILAGIAAYDYVEGGGSFFNFLQNHTSIPNSVSGAPPGYSCSEGMHWDPYIGGCVVTR
jgi:hypothetical protein